MVSEKEAALLVFHPKTFDMPFDPWQVENGQHMHFQQLWHTLRHLGYKWVDKLAKDGHVKFGRVEGMSTRRGEVVFLSDILDEAQARMVKLMKQKASEYRMKDA